MSLVCAMLSLDARGTPKGRYAIWPHMQLPGEGRSEDSGLHPHPDLTHFPRASKIFVLVWLLFGLRVETLIS